MLCKILTNLDGAELGGGLFGFFLFSFPCLPLVAQFLDEQM